MKRNISIFLIFFIMLTNFVNVFAAPHKKTPHKKISAFNFLEASSLNTLDITYEKNVDVSISADITKVNVGDTIQLDAKATKHGSDYLDNWVNAAKESTVFDSVYGEYISTAIFVANSPGIYTISYSINMDSGTNTSKFFGTDSITIEVIDSVTVVGAEIRNIRSMELKNPDGSIKGYSCVGDVYILYSDGSSKIYNSIFYYLGAEEASKQLYVSVTSDNVKYTYLVTVTR